MEVDNKGSECFIVYKRRCSPNVEKITDNNNLLTIYQKTMLPISQKLRTLICYKVEKDTEYNCHNYHIEK